MKQKEFKVKGFQTPDRFLLQKLPGIQRSSQDFSQTQSKYFSMLSANINQDLKQFLISQMKQKMLIKGNLSSVNKTNLPSSQQQRKLSQIVSNQYHQFENNNKISQQTKNSNSLAILKLIKNRSVALLGSNQQQQSSRKEVENTSQIEKEKQFQVDRLIGNNLEELSKQKKRLNQQLCKNSVEIQNQLRKINENSEKIGMQQAFQITKKRNIIKNCSKLQPFIDQQKIVKFSNQDYIKIDKNSFNLKHVVGRGGFGKVWLVQSKKTKKLYAMKEMSKQRILQKKSIHSVMNERKLLSSVKHPLLVNMVCAFQDSETLYLIMDFMSGGDLRFHVGQKRFFNEECTKFFACCIIESLSYLHKNNIIHRDIKPENLVLDSRGYVHITDLGIARHQSDNNSSDTSGTPGYMAPEVMFRKNHTMAVDYYALGVIIYEFMLGRRPYQGKDRKEIREAIKLKQVKISKKELPRTWSSEAADFVNSLLERKAEQRLGFKGNQQVKEHPWLRDFDWEGLGKKLIEPPFIPNKKKDNFDERQVNIDDRMTINEEYVQNSILLKTPEVQNLFYHYTYESSSLNYTENSQKSTGSSFNYVKKMLQ